MVFEIENKLIGINYKVLMMLTCSMLFFFSFSRFFAMRTSSLFISRMRTSTCIMLSAMLFLLNLNSRLFFKSTIVVIT